MSPFPTDRERRVDPLSTTVAEVLLLAGRVAIAIFFVLSGALKISDAEKGVATFASFGLPMPAFLQVASILICIIGGALLAIGYKTKIVAGMLSLLTIMTAAMTPLKMVDQAHLTQLCSYFAIIGGLMQVAALGGGRWSLDFS